MKSNRVLSFGHGAPVTRDPVTSETNGNSGVETIKKQYVDANSGSRSKFVTGAIHGVTPSDFVDQTSLSNKALSMQATKPLALLHQPELRFQPKIMTQPKDVDIDSDVAFIRLKKLITDDNLFSPELTAGRMSLRNKFLDRTHKPDELEFDSSDRDLPEKNSLLFRKSRAFERGNTEHQPGVVSNPHETRRQDSKTSTSEDLRISTNTPRRSSPLRREVTKDFVDTSAVDAVNAISESSAIRPRTTQEIFDKINSSIERFKVYDKKKRNVTADSTSSNESDGSGDSDEEILQSLHLLLPPRKSETTEIQPESNNLHESRKRLRPVESNVLILGSPGQNRTSKPKNQYKRKNTRVIRKKLGHSMNRPVLKPWLVEKWTKLRALVELSVPNHVIINNKMVQKKLGCESREELAQRVNFLAQKL